MNILRLPVFSSMVVNIKNTADWRDALWFKDPDTGETLDITGISFRAHMRPEVDSPVLAGGFEMSTTNGLLVNYGRSGFLSWAVPASMMTTVEPREYVMDVEATQGPYTTQLFPADPAVVTVYQGVTR